MEQIISNLRPFTFKVFLLSAFALLFLAPGCNSNDNNRDKQPLAQNATTENIAPDSLKLTGNVKLDSMLRLTVNAKQDTNLAKLYFDIGDSYLYSNNSAKAKEYYFKVDSLSKLLNWTRGSFLFAAGYTDVLNREGLMDSAIVIHQTTLKLLIKNSDERSIASTLVNLGNCYNYKQWDETALKYYNEALPLFEKQGNKYYVAHLYNLMSTVYNRLFMQDENLLYSEKTIEIYKEKPDTLPRAGALNNYALALIKKHELDKAENCLVEAQRICKLHNAKHYLSPIYINLGTIAIEQNDLDYAEMYIRKAMEFDNTEANRLFGNIEKLRGNFDLSEKYAREALKTADEYDLPLEKMKCYTLLADISTARHDFQKYRFYQSKSDSIQLTVISEKTQRYAKEMEAKNQSKI